MSTDIAIRAAGLGKRYRIGAQREKYRTLRESIMASGDRLRNRNPKEEFWALRDLDLEVKRGEVLGIIGRNGAGKSTLLKILSRITDPTTGYAEIHGRVGSLLEVGSGFNMELSGRENVYLNGAILGMRRNEIEQRFDDIVAFAEVEQFIDTPVKRYSSGMYMRLAFAVAAHLEPEILLVDEVLAVGDVEFQRKCLGRMGEIAGHGRTVLFVSHNLSAVQALCDRVSFLANGGVVLTGEPEQVIEAYQDDAAAPEGNYRATEVLSFRTTRILSARIRSLDAGTSRVRMGEGFELEMHVEPGEKTSVAVSVMFRTQEAGTPIVGWDTRVDALEPVRLVGPTRIALTVEEMNLMPGMYVVDLSIWDTANKRLHAVESALTFEITPAPVTVTGRVPTKKSRVFLPCHWSTVAADSLDLHG